MYQEKQKVWYILLKHAKMKINPGTLFQDKTLKQKAKVEMLSSMLINKNLSIDDLVDFAKKSDDNLKATCIETIEYTTKKNQGIANEKCLKFVIQTLADDAPRVKWESARVIGNIAPVLPSKLKPAIKALLINSENKGTVVRWATAYALGEIIKLNTAMNKDLLPAIEAICKREVDNGVKKKYLDALKKLKK